jgi:hypothetical protein
MALASDQQDPEGRSAQTAAAPEGDGTHATCADERGVEVIQGRREQSPDGPRVEPHVDRKDGSSSRLRLREGGVERRAACSIRSEEGRGERTPGQREAVATGGSRRESRAEEPRAGGRQGLCNSGQPTKGRGESGPGQRGLPESSSERAAVIATASTQVFVSG